MKHAIITKTLYLIDTALDYFSISNHVLFKV